MATDMQLITFSLCIQKFGLPPNLVLQVVTIVLLGSRDLLASQRKHSKRSNMMKQSL